MTSCVEKLNVLLDHWVVFEKNNTYPDLNHWKKVIKQEYEDDNMDAAVAAADIAAADAPPADLPSAPPTDLPSDNPAPASDKCIPLLNDSRCTGKMDKGLNYNTYCPRNKNCNLKNVCVTKASHCQLIRQLAMADNSKDIGQDKNNMRSVKGFMKAGN
jgi:hypothetical protein